MDLISIPQSYFFDRDDVALPGFAKYFREVAKCELEEAERFMKFQNDRGGRILFSDVSKPTKDEWGTGMLGSSMLYGASKVLLEWKKSALSGLQLSLLVNCA